MESHCSTRGLFLCIQGRSPLLDFTWMKAATANCSVAPGPSLLYTSCPLYNDPAKIDGVPSGDLCNCLEHEIADNLDTLYSDDVSS